MRKANRKTINLIDQRIGEVRISEQDRALARSAVRDAETIVDAILWIRDKFGSIGAFLLKPGYRH